MKAITSGRLQNILMAADQAKADGELIAMSPELVESLVAALQLAREREALQTTIITDLSRQIRKMARDNAAS